eukprot:scaffold630_cov399-Prasinococcus_capsulatus_cf.AAC.41
MDSSSNLTYHPAARGKGKACHAHACTSFWTASATCAVVIHVLGPPADRDVAQGRKGVAVRAQATVRCDLAVATVLL